MTTISIVITSFKEPKTIGKAIESFLKQNLKNYELVISAPDKETLNVAKSYAKNNERIKIFQDKGKGKTLAINQILPQLKGEMIILTDGDVYVSENSVEEIMKFFQDKEVGCVAGRPVSQNERDNMFGYWSHLLCYAAHRMRLRRHEQGKFLECSGYLFAFRNGIIKEIPRETAEDAIIPIIFFFKGLRTKYAENAEVFVKYPTNLKEFIDQKQRTAKGHETLGKYVDIKKVPKMKSLKNEILESYTLFSFPRTLKEFFWTIWLFPFRFYIWMLSFYKLYVKKDMRVDGWQAVESTK